MADMYSNPLPPPSMRPPAPEPAQPKSNADFRALLATPRAERGGGYRSSFAGGGGERKEQKEKKAKKPPRPKPADEEAKKEEDDGSGYRYGALPIVTDLKLPAVLN